MHLQVARHAGVSFFFRFGCSFLIVSMFSPSRFVLELVCSVAVAVIVSVLLCSVFSCLFFLPRCVLVILVAYLALRNEIELFYVSSFRVVQDYACLCCLVLVFSVLAALYL